MLLRRRCDKAELPDELEKQAAEPSVEPEPDEKEDLDALTVPQIKERLDAAGISYKNSDNKPELIQKLKGE